MAGSENEPAISSSGEEEVSSEGSGSESEPDKTSTPPPSSKPPSSSSSDESDAQPSRATAKRPAAAAAEEADSGALKRKKTVVAVAAPDADNNIGEKKQQLFQRLWSEENEIELIQGMIDYVEAKGKDPLADVNDFHEFVKKSLHVDVNDRQVLTKARRLKKKFENNAAKVETKGRFRSLSNPHEKKMYELSKNLWGSDGNNNVVMKKVKVKVNVTQKTNKSQKGAGSGDNGNVGIEVDGNNEVQPKVVHPIQAVRGLGYFGSVTDEVIMNQGLELVSGEKRVELEAKWKSLKVQELQHFLKKLDVLKEQAEVVLNAIAKSGAK